MKNKHKIAAFLLIFLAAAWIYWIVCFAAKKGNAWLIPGFFLETLVVWMCHFTFSPAFFFLLFKNYFDKTYQKIIFSLLPQTHFTLLVPAHNEAHCLPKLLNSISELNYPKHLFDVLLIADNCTDRTAELAKAQHLKVVERKSIRNSDKTQALAFAAEVFEQEKWRLDSVVLVIDADCALMPDFLLGFDHCFSQNPNLAAAQCYRKVGNPFASKTALLDAAAEALRQRVNCNLRHLLGLDNYLHGLGTAFRMPVFCALTKEKQLVFADDKAWKAHLAAWKQPIGYAPQAVLHYEACAAEAGFQNQRLRWVTGHYDMIRTFAGQQFVQAVGRLDLTQLDFFMSIITLPRSFILLFCAMFALVAVVFPAFSLYGIWVWLSLFFAFFAYAALGFWLIRAPKAAYWHIFGGFSTVFGIIRSNIKSLLRQGSTAWEQSRVP